MSLAAISLAALVLALVVSCISSVNIGVLSIVLAWIVGTYLAGIPLAEVIAGFPTPLFLTLAGVTLLFSQAQVNGTLDGLAHRAIRLCRGNTGVVPMMFFVLTAMLSSIGPGNIASCALMAPIGMAAAGRYGIPPFLMAIMIANAASAGSVSPVAPTGVIANTIAVDIGLADTQWPIYRNNLIVHTIVAFSGYFLFGGWRLFSRSRPEATAETSTQPDEADSAGAPFQWRQWLTLAVIVVLVVSVVFFNLNVGFVAFTGAILLTFAGAADETKAVRQMPWKVILMVCGVSTLIAILEKTGGMSLFTDILARLATPATATAVTAFFTGVVSIYSSTTGVVLPAFLPMVPGLIERMGGGDPMAIFSSMTVAGHLVDVSPVSTLGALCMAAAAAGTDLRVLFNQLLAWGVSMSLVGALLCWLVF